MYDPLQLFDLNHDVIKYNSDSNQKKGVLIEGKKVPLITFPSLSAFSFLSHGFSTRLGGCSRQECSTMNLSFLKGNNKEHVMQNYRLIGEELHMKPENMVSSDQVHKTEIQVVTKEHRGNGIVRENELKGIDGLITNEKNVALVTFYADCVPLFFVDIKKQVIALSHAGWRGTVQKIGRVTIQKMKEHYDSDPADIVAVIGPSICKDCYEVSEDVAEEFLQEFSEEEAQNILEKKENKKYQLDLWLANQYILLEEGIKEENISISEICTCCNPSLLFSHRASGGKRGNLAAFLSLV